MAQRHTPIPHAPAPHWRIATAHRDRIAREALRRALSKGPFDLLWHAGDASELEFRSRESPPQLVLVELELLGPHAEAVDALRRQGSAVVALAKPDAVGAAYEAMGHGVLGLAEPPGIADDGELLGAPKFLTQIERLARLVQIEAPTTTPVEHAGAPGLVAIGASTGGPLALSTVLGSLPADFPGAVVVVQHIESEYSAGLAKWLSTYCALPVELAARGDAPAPGRVHVAGPGGHLVLTASGRYAIHGASPSDLHAPGIDALFKSLAQHAEPGAAAILTGMGTDGVAGLAALRARGWLTLAQDEASSVVYGMPRAAVESGAAERALPLADIGPALARHITRRVRQ
jgi:two-component system response regulator WspF